jgi:GT2 family glycosyltransferase
MCETTLVFPIVRWDYILPAIETLRAVGPETTVIVVNQSRPNATFETELWDAADLVIRTKKNYGFAQAANLGTSLVVTEYVTICNDDVLFLPYWWDGVKMTFDQFPRALGVVPFSPKEPGWGYGEKDFRIHATLEELADNPEAVVKRLVRDFEGIVIDGFPAWCVTLPRQEWLDLGMFDERFFPGGGEDYDACARVYQKGRRFLASSLSWVWHHWGKTKSEKDGFSMSLPNARPGWNKLSTKGFGAEGLWDPDCDVWGQNCKRTNPEVRRMPL